MGWGAALRPRRAGAFCIVSTTPSWVSFGGEKRAAHPILAIAPVLTLLSASVFAGSPAAAQQAVSIIASPNCRRRGQQQ